jgi:hypothetical protein
VNTLYVNFSTLYYFLSHQTLTLSLSLPRYVHTAISQDGRLTTNAFMAEYNQDRFELDIQAKEVQPPERIAVAKVYVSACLFSFSQCFFYIDKNSIYACMHS